MFTGIIQHKGTVKKFSQNKLCIHFPKLSTRLPTGQAGNSQLATQFNIGDSVAVNGACLTVASRQNGTLTFDVSPETLKRTNLGKLHVADLVNLEKPLTVKDLVGGHCVTGHVDEPIRILFRKKIPNGFFKMRFSLPQSLRHLIAIKGSVAIDGISLT
ncbi:MAG: riboflavin synthase, partial [Elusimicrobia bacterium]|nr:riboflavin synthase [Elusimicrobiota bacterium]